MMSLPKHNIPFSTSHSLQSVKRNMFDWNQFWNHDVRGHQCFSKRLVSLSLSQHSLDWKSLGPFMVRSRTARRHVLLRPHCNREAWEWTWADDDFIAWLSVMTALQKPTKTYGSASTRGRHLNSIGGSVTCGHQKILVPLLRPLS